jgi:transcriptional regulator with XRE-family HTH domain
MDGRELQEIRLAYVGTQADLAEQLGVSRVTVSDWERGAAPVPRTVEIIARLLRNNPVLTKRVMEIVYVKNR